MAERLPISETAENAVGLDFNPSGSPRVLLLKKLAAAFITECENMADDGIARREAKVAITEMETACMWAVKAATKGLS